MLKRTMRAVAESAGILAPTIPDATQAAEQRRQELVASQAAIASAERELEALYDRGASPKDIAEGEARIADAKLTADRTQRAYNAAEKRLTTARAADAEKIKSAAIVARDEALAIRASAAAEIDRLAGLLAEQARMFDAQIGTLNEAARAGVASHSMRASAASLIGHSLEKAGALPSAWIGGREDQPGAVTLAMRDAGAVLAVA